MEIIESGEVLEDIVGSRRITERPAVLLSLTGSSSGLLRAMLADQQQRWPLHATISSRGRRYRYRHCSATVRPIRGGGTGQPSVPALHSQYGTAGLSVHSELPHHSTSSSASSQQEQEEARERSAGRAQDMK